MKKDTLKYYDCEITVKYKRSVYDKFREADDRENNAIIKQAHELVYDHFKNKNNIFNIETNSKIEKAIITLKEQKEKDVIEKENQAKKNETCYACGAVCTEGFALFGMQKVCIICYKGN